MSKDGDISEEERELFRRSTQGVKPLHRSERTCPPKKAFLSTSNLSSSFQRISEKTSTFFPLSSYLVESVASETILHFYHSDISKKQLNELKNGQYIIDAVLDLHGCMPNDAQCLLSTFITTQHALNRRCVLLIHGKGGHRGEAPVIKNLVNRWLPQFPQVLAFHSALPKHGGAGALYVLLKKNRENLNKA